MTRSKLSFRPRASVLALEPRVLFDGAGAMAAVDYLADVPAKTESAKEVEAEKTPATAAPVTLASPRAEDAGISRVGTDSVITTVLIVDTRVADQASLLAGLPANAVLRVVDSGESGLNAVSQALAGLQGIESVQIISHGTPGSFTLGSDTVDAASVAAHGAQLQAWAGHLTADADILLYGCDVGQGAQGESLITQLAAVTGADIAASSNATGAAAKGGDWVLERNTGAIEASVVLSQAALAGYTGLLTEPTVTDMGLESPVSVGENAINTPVGNLISVTGTGTDTLTVVATVGKGTLSAATFTGDMLAVQNWIAGLTYTYTGTSESGDTDTLALQVTNDTSPSVKNFTRTLTIAPQNDAPTVSPPSVGAPGRLSAAEGGSVFFVAATGSGVAGSPVGQVNLGLADPDNSPNQIIIKVAAGGTPAKGVLKLGGNELTVGSTFALSDIANLSYVHNGNQVANGDTDSIVLTVDDGAGGLVTSQTITIDLTPVNQVPDATGSVIVIEGEQDVSLVGGTVPAIGGDRGSVVVTDPDDSGQTVTVKSLPANGTLKYDGALVTVNQSITSANLSLFTYSHNGSETSNDSFNITVTDAGGGTGSPATSADKTINLVVLPNNDDPILVNNTGVIFGPDAPPGAPSNTSSVTITPAMLQVTDADSPVTQLTYTLTSIPSGGYLTFGATGLALPVGYSFTQQDLADGMIKFVSLNGSSHDTDFKFTVKDSDQRLLPTQRNGGIYEADDTTLQVNTFTIKYQGTATGTGSGGAFPPFAVPNAPGGTLALTDAQIAENQTVLITSAELTTTDSDNTPEQLVYRLLSVPSNGKILLNGTPLSLLGSFTQKDINDNKVSFQHDGSEDFTSSFTFDVSDGNSTTAITTFNIDVKPQNDTPTAGTGSIKITEGGSQVINVGGASHIVLADSDNDSSDKTNGFATDNVLSFEVTALPTQGQLLLNGTAVTLNQVITKADLDAGKLQYVHNGSENYADSFKIVPLDDQNITTAGAGGLPAVNPTNQISRGIEKQVTINVNPLNDAPTYVGKAEPGDGTVPFLTEGGTLTIAGAVSYGGGASGSGTATAPAPTVAHLIYQDSDNTSEQRQYRVTTATQFGTMTANGRTLSVGSVFTQAELDTLKVQYKHSSAENQPEDFFEYTVSDGDFGSNQNTADNGTAFVQGAVITPSRYTIKLVSANDKPTITTGFSGLFVVDSSATAKDLPNFTLGDKDLADGLQGPEVDFVQVSVEFLTSADAAYNNGVLQFKSVLPAGVTVTNAAGDNTLVFQGTLASVQAALNLVQAKTAGADADLANLKIKVTVDDRLRDGSGNLTPGANGGALNEDGTAPNNTFNVASVTINVAASDKNDPPVVTLPGATVVVNEDVRTPLKGASAISFTDPDAFNSTTNTVQLTVTQGTLYFSSTGTGTPAGVTVQSGAIGTNTVTLQGTKAALDNALDNLRYQSNLDYNGDDVLTVTVGDGGNNGIDGPDNSGGGSNTGTVNIAILPVNDKPTVTLPGANGYFALTGGSYVFSGGNAISIADNKDFGAVAPAQDGLDTNFSVTLDAKLGAGAYGYGTISVTTPGAVVTGNGTGIVILTGSRADINAALASGVTFVPATPNPDGTVEFRVRVDDNNNGGTALTDPATNTLGITGPQTDSKLLYLQPTAVNDPPAFAGLNNTPTYVQNGNPVVLDGNALLSDPELDLFGASGKWQGAVLTLQRDGGANVNDVFGTTGSGNAGVNLNGANVRVGTTVVGTVSNTGGTLQITFNGSATASRVDTVLQGLTYKNTEANPGNSVKINYLIDDQNPNTGGTGTAGGGQDQGTGGKLTATGSITIGINRQIIATPDTNAITEAAAPGDIATASGDVSPGTTNSNDNGGTQDRDPDAAQTIVVQGVKAGTEPSVVAIGTGGVGSAVIGTYGSVVINPDGTYTYTLDNTNTTVNALKPGETLTDVFSYAINDGQGVNKTTDFTTLTITINGANDPPVATPNTNTVTENTGTPAIGNVKTDGTSDSDPDNAMTGVPLTDIVATTAGGASTPVTVGTQVVGKYGTLTIAPDGSYSYLLDDSNPDVNALVDLETLTEVFTYTIKDPGLLSSTSTLTITINGKTDGAPSISPVDGNGGAVIGQATVFEKGLTSAGDTTETTTGAITVTAADGIKSVTIGGQVFTVAQLAALNPGTPSTAIDTGEGLLSITGLTVVSGPAAVPTEATVSYTYTLKAAITNAAPADMESTDTIALVVTDNSAGAKTGLGNLVIQIVDDVPAAVADTNSITKGTATVTGNAFTNDAIGADGSAGAGPVTGIAGGTVGTARVGTYGAITLNADGTYSYALNNANATVAALINGQTLTETFNYTITDKDGDTSSATITITINGLTPNALPVAVNDAFTLDEDTPYTGTLKGNDAPSADGGNVWTKTTDPAHGAVIVNPDGTFVYTPDPDYYGPDSFTYTITDTDGDKSTATVTLTVTPVNDVPVAVDDKASTPKNVPIKGSLTGNDKPSTDGGNVWSKTTDPTNGTVVVNPDGTYTYTPNAGFTGTDSFTYTITDKDGDKSTATVTITVQPPVTPPPNDVPVAVNDSASTPKDMPIQGSLTGNDKPSTDGGNVWSKTTDPTNGTVVVNPDGTYTYTPNAGFTGTDSFTYTITDKDGDKSTATVTITVQPPVTPPNDVPVAVNDSASTPKDMPIQGSLTGNDKPSADGGNVWSKTTDPKNGTVVVNPDGTYTYTPNAGFTGTDSFTYTITDKDGDKSTATVTITVQPPVTPPNDVPVARPDTVQTEVGKPVTGDLGSNDKPSADGGNVWSKTTDPANGTVVVNPGGTYTYTPNPGFTGTDSFTYTITDQSGDQSTATVAVQVVQPTLVDDVRVEGPYFGWDRSEPALRLTIPFDPVEYVGREVTRAQNERELTDPLTFSNPAAVQQRGVQATSLGAALGFDPALFVQHAVRESQARGQLWSDIVEGRLARLSLGSDGRIPTPEWFEPSDAQIVPRMPEQDKPAAEADKPADVRPRPTAGAVPGPVQEAVHSAALRPSPAAAPSFSEQLRSTASRPVAGAARPVSPGSIVS